MTYQLLEKIVDVVRDADCDVRALTAGASALKLYAVDPADIVDVDGVAVLDRTVGYLLVAAALEIIPSS